MFCPTFPDSGLYLHVRVVLVVLVVGGVGVGGSKLL